MLTRLKELTKSFGSHVEPENTEQLKRTKAEVEKNVTKILTLIKNEDRGKKEGKQKASKKETELLGLVENFYKNYESLYALYDHLIGESGKTVNHGTKEKKCSSDSSLDSEYFSSEELDVDNVKLESEAASLEVAELKHELASVIEQNNSLKLEYNELKIEADKKDGEISALVKANEAHETQSLARIRELEGQLASLKTETETLRGQKRDQEPRREGIAAEAKQIGEKRKGWCSRVLELDATLKDKENENSVLLKTLNENENIFTSKIVEIKAQVKELMDQKTELKVQLERKTAEILDNLVQIESLTEELARKVLAEKKMEGENQASQQRERENVLTKKKNLQGVEKRIEDLAEKFQTSLEHKLRLMYLRISVTEQLHTENKESYKLTKERQKKENRELEEKIKSHESEFQKMKEVSELAEYALNGLDLVVRKFEEENGNFLTHISKVSNEIQFAKTWVTGTSGEIKRLKHNLDDKEEQEFLLRDKVWKLEAEMSKEGGEKLNLIQAISQLEKKLGKYERLINDKDERPLSLRDEEREAIRQLCILVDYHRGRFDHLKQVVSKIRPKMRAY